MSENDEAQPLTRRERRLREMAETGAVPIVDSNASQGAGGDGAASSDDELEISPVDETGRQRTRRELRELREQALAARAAARAEEAAAAEPVAPAEPETAAEPEASVEPEAVPEQLPAEATAVETERGEAESAGASVDEADEPEEPIAATQAFSLQDLAEATAPAAERAEAPAEPAFDDFLAAAQQSTARPETEEVDFNDFLSGLGERAQEAPAESVQTPGLQDLFGEREAEAPAGAEVPLDAAAEAAASTEEPAEAAAADEEHSSGGRRLRLPWQRRGEKETPAEAVDPEPAEARAAEASPAESVAEAQPVAEAAEVEAFDIDADDADADAELASAEAPQSAQGYSFPDIVPLDDQGSVFDDPTRAQRASQQDRARPQAGFDDLISNAIAQEGDTGSTGSANTSALILPSMPQSDSLTGPLGETGELFLTGSIELPKSLGETGGHSMLHDSVEHDPIDDLGLGLGSPAVTDSSVAPVSANRAVSARVIPGPVLSEASRERSKVPTVLMLTGGGLLVVIAGLAVWGFGSGMFN